MSFAKNLQITSVEKIVLVDAALSQEE